MNKPCNWCGEEASIREGMAVDIKFQGKYESTPGNGFGALDDCSEYSFTLCEFCLDHLMSLFRIPATDDDYMDNTKHPYIPAAERVNKGGDGRKMKKEFFDEQKRRALVRPIIK